MSKCIKCSCDIPVGRRSERYCSLHCAKLFLKAQSKKRNREKVNEYHRRYRKLGVRHISMERRKELVQRLGARCERCGVGVRIDVHHIKPLRLGGTNDYRNLLLLCRTCHQLWHKTFDNQFWVCESKNENSNPPL